MDAQLLGNLRHVLAIGRAHPPAHISLDALAVGGHRSVPSGHLVVKTVGMERRHLSLQRVRCGTLLDGEDPDPLQHQVIEIPPMTPTAIELRLEMLPRVACP
jgi:hypothetical protein